MIAVDSNLLIYAHREDSKFHRAAKELVHGLRQSSAPWAIPWPCVHEFIGIVTHANIYKPPTALKTAFDAIDTFAAGNLHFLSESDGYFEKLWQVATAAKISGPRIHDARIAALCLHHGVRELWTADRDFSAFPQIKTRNPLMKI
jgi:toxin-antitoxin system PIN domain toxin